MWGRELITVGGSQLFDRLDTISFSTVDVVILKPLPLYARPGTSQITEVVEITSPEGDRLIEVMSGDIVGATAGSFAYNANRVITLVFEKGAFLSSDEARTAVANFQILFQLTHGTSYIPGQYIAEFIDLGTGNKFYHSRILDMEKLQNLIDTNIQAANLNPYGMNPFSVTIRGVLRA